MRLANDRPWSEDLGEAARARRIELLNFDLSSAKTSLNSMRQVAKKVLANIESASARLAKASSFHGSCIQFEKVLARALEGVDASRLRFDGDQYIGPNMASLYAEKPVANVHLESACVELRWLPVLDGQVCLLTIKVLESLLRNIRKTKACYRLSSRLFNAHKALFGSSTWARTRDLRINSRVHTTGHKSVQRTTTVKSTT